MAFSSSAAQHVEAWVYRLAQLTQPVPAERIATVAAMLERDGFPSAAYCGDSLHAAAEGERFFPPYAEIRRKLGLWWRANNPTPRLAAPVARPDPPGHRPECAAERDAIVARFRPAFAEAVAPARAMNDRWGTAVRSARPDRVLSADELARARAASGIKGPA